MTTYAPSEGFIRIRNRRAIRVQQNPTSWPLNTGLALETLTRKMGSFNESCFFRRTMLSKTSVEGDS
jgi:hypothetical protein